MLFWEALPRGQKASVLMVSSCVYNATEFQTLGTLWVRPAQDGASSQEQGPASAHPLLMRALERPGFGDSQETPPPTRQEVGRQGRSWAAWVQTPVLLLTTSPTLGELTHRPDLQPLISNTGNMTQVCVRRKRPGRGAVRCCGDSILNSTGSSGLTAIRGPSAQGQAPLQLPTAHPFLPDLSPPRGTPHPLSCPASTCCTCCCLCPSPLLLTPHQLPGLGAPHFPPQLRHHLQEGLPDHPLASLLSNHDDPHDPCLFLKLESGSARGPGTSSYSLHTAPCPPFNLTGHMHMLM